MSEPLIKVRVSSRRKGGHRRIGQFIPEAETELDVTPEQLKILRADGTISVVELAPAPAKSAK